MSCPLVQYQAYNHLALRLSDYKPDIDITYTLYIYIYIYNYIYNYQIIGWETLIIYIL